MELLKNRSLVYVSACNVAIDPHELVDIQIGEQSGCVCRYIVSVNKIQ